MLLSRPTADQFVVDDVLVVSALHTPLSSQPLLLMPLACCRPFPRQLLLQYNQINGTIPTTLGMLTALQYVLLWLNQLSSSRVPSAQCRCFTCGLYPTCRRVLSIPNNNLVGTIPSSIFTLPAVTNLQLQNNGLTGTLPSNLGMATTLTYLDMSGNRLTGPLPSSVAGLQQLT